MSCARVLLVGGGITSAVTASLLAEAAPSLRLTVWDKARGAGGRMSTARGRTARTQVDTGAQYVSSTPDMFRAHGDIYAALLESGVLAPANTSAIHGMREERLAEGEATRHFVAPDGMSSLVKHFFKLSGAELNFGRRVAEVIKVSQMMMMMTKYPLDVSPFTRARMCGGCGPSAGWRTCLTRWCSPCPCRSSSHSPATSRS